MTEGQTDRLEQVKTCLSNYLQTMQLQGRVQAHNLGPFEVLLSSSGSQRDKTL